MAAQGILTALQAALAGLGGGIEGAQSYRAYEQKRKREEDIFNYQRQRDLLQDARQRELDAARLREEERSAADAGMVSADRLRAMTMPGATPLPAMEPTMRQTIGGKEYVYSPELKRAEAHRASVEQTKMAQAIRRAEQSYTDKELTALADEARKGGRQSTAAAKLAARSKGAYEALFPEPQRTSALDALRAEEAMRERQAQEAQGMAFLNANRTNNEVKTGYGAIFAANPKMSPGMIGYALQQQALAGALESQRDASAGASAARTDATKAKTAGRAPSAPPPNASKAPAATPPAPAPDELDAAYDKYTTRKR